MVGSRGLNQTAPRGAAAGGIVGQGDGAAGPAEFEVLGFIGINRKMNPLAAELRGDGVDQSVLCPDAGVMQLGLMAGGDQGLIVGVSEGLPETTPHLGHRDVLNASRFTL